MATCPLGSSAWDAVVCNTIARQREAAIAIVFRANVIIIFLLIQWNKSTAHKKLNQKVFLFRLAVWFCQIECTACQFTCCPCKTRRGVLLKTIHSWGGCMDDVIYTSAALVWMRFATSFCNELNVNLSKWLYGRTCRFSANLWVL